MLNATECSNYTNLLDLVEVSRKQDILFLVMDIVAPIPKINVNKNNYEKNIIY